MQDVLVEMSANMVNGRNELILDDDGLNDNINNNNNKSQIDSVEDVISDIKNIRIEPLDATSSNNDDNNISGDNATNNNHPCDDEAKQIDELIEEGPGRRKSKRLKKIRIEKRKELKEARKIKLESAKAEDNNDSKVVKPEEEEEEETPVILIEDITGLPHFRNIQENIYLFSRNKSRKNKFECDCIPLTRDEKREGLRGCEEGCLNRMLNYECSSNCPLGKRCANKRFQKKEYAKIIPFKTELKGWGLKALEDIEVNKFIMEYVGEVIDAFHFHDRVDAYAAEKIEHYYFMSLKKDEIIDSTKKGNITRFINHSCEPNCSTQKWVTGNEDRIGFFAIKPIKKGEELTFDYQFQRYGEKAQKCYCGTPSCRGVIGSAKAGPNILTDGTKIDEKLRSEIEIGQEQLQEDIIEEFYQMYHEDGIDSVQTVKEIMKVMVQTDLTNPYLQGKIIDVLLSTKANYLKLVVDYRCLIFFWEWMKNTEDLNLKIDFLKLLKILPLESRTIVVENKIFHLVELWAKNPRKKNENLEEPSASDVDKEAMHTIIQELSQELIKNWNALPEAAKIPKELKIKMRKSDEQKAMNEEETSKKEENDNRRKEIRENFWKIRQAKNNSLQPSVYGDWSVQNKNDANYKGSSENNNTLQSSEPMTEEEWIKQEKAKQDFREKFEREVAQSDYEKAISKYHVEYGNWMAMCRKRVQEVSETKLIQNQHTPPPPIPKLTVAFKEPVCIVPEKTPLKRKRIDFLLEPFDKLVSDQDSSKEPEEEDLSFIDFNDLNIAPYRKIYNDQDIIFKCDLDDLFYTGPNLVTLKECNCEYFKNQTLPSEYIDLVPLKDVSYQSDDIFESMNKTVFDATYPYQGAYVNLEGTQYMQGVLDTHTPTMVCKEIVAQPLPISFTKSKLTKVQHPWRRRRTSDGQTFYYNPNIMFTQWPHPLVDPSENLSLNDIEKVLNGQPRSVAVGASTSTDAKLSAEQLRNNKLNNSLILKMGEQRTKERLERQKQKKIEHVRKIEEECFKRQVSKYVVNCLNPHLSTQDKKRKIRTKEEFKKIAESFTLKVFEAEIIFYRNEQKKATLTDTIKGKIKQKVKQYVLSK